MAQPLTFESATAADWPAIWAIWHEVVAAGDTYVYDPDTTEEQARSMWLHASGAATFVARDGARVVGVYKLAPNHGGPGSHVANGSYMVDAAVRGGGVGRAMVEHSVAVARDAGYRGIQFNAVAASNVYAIGLYERLGFVELGRVPRGFRHPDQGFVDLVIMYLALV